MFKGGYHYTPKIAKVFRYGGLLVPAIFIIYGTLIKDGYIETSHFSDIFMVYILAFWWTALSVLDFFTSHKSKLDSILRLASYHLLVGAFIVFISGMASSFVAGWLILMAMSYSCFPQKGLLYSSLSFILVIAFDILLSYDTASLISGLVMLAVILAINIAWLYFNKSQSISKSELNRSKNQEGLQKERFSTIINNLTYAVLSTDVHGVIKTYNSASLNLLDTNENLNGKNVKDILNLENVDGEKIDIISELHDLKMTVKRDDLNFCYSDGEKIRLEVTLSPIKSSYSKSKKTAMHDDYILIMHDVTKSKSLEEERDEFISVISHELRTPITIAEGTISNVQMMMDHPNVTQETLKESIKVAHDQVLFLANMVNDLSALSRAERGVGDATEIIDVQELAHRLMDKYTPEASIKGLMLNLDLAPNVSSVNTSRLYLEELLQNFITNSIKYTKEGSVTIKISQKDGEINFAVKDTGIGISKTDQTKVFNKFYRSEDYRTRETGGTGLGLYVAAKLANKLGTRIQLTSRLNFGSTFSFTLPADSSKTN